jgi:hypothetical protein
MSPMKPGNIDVNGKTRPASTQGIAAPKAMKGSVKEAEGMIKGDPKKAGEGLIQQQRGVHHKAR